MSDKNVSTHSFLWLVIAFALGTLWTPLVDLAITKFWVDNDVSILNEAPWSWMPREGWEKR